MPDAPRFFGRRRGRKLRQSGEALLESLLPGLAIPRPEPGGRFDPLAWFAEPPRALWLEVGFGGGEHLAWQAARNPDIGVIGCEVFVNGIASLLGHVARDELRNVRIFPEDARLLLNALPGASLARVFVLFPDPWPKHRHAERRFICPENLDSLSRSMADGAELRIATDHPVYRDWAPRQMAARSDFELIAVDPLRRPPDWPATRYETKALKDNRVPLLMRYRRRARTKAVA
jgi:tRNA (guanine-N7-)-methyltransferase